MIKNNFIFLFSLVLGSVWSIDHKQVQNDQIQCMRLVDWPEKLVMKKLTRYYISYTYKITFDICLLFVLGDGSRKSTETTFVENCQNVA